MRTKGIIVGINQTPNQYSAVTACCSDFTPRLRRRAFLSMFISLETRHLAWDWNIFFFHFLFSLRLATFFFSTKISQKKLTPNFADRFGRFGQCGRPSLTVRSCFFYGPELASKKSASTRNRFLKTLLAVSCAELIIANKQASGMQEWTVTLFTNKA